MVHVDSLNKNTSPQSVKMRICVELYPPYANFHSGRHRGYPQSHVNLIDRSPNEYYAVLKH